MTSVHMFRQSACPQKIGTVLLTSMLFLGCAAGIWLSRDAAPQFADAVGVLSDSAGGFALILILAMPMLFSALAVYVKRPVFLLPLAFWKAFFFSYVFCGFMSVCGSAGWMVCSLGLFSGLCSLPVLCWYWLRHMGGRKFSLRSFLAALALLFAAGLLDLRVVSPFLAKILTF